MTADEQTRLRNRLTPEERIARLEVQVEELHRALKVARNELNRRLDRETVELIRSSLDERIRAMELKLNDQNEKVANLQGRIVTMSASAAGFGGLVGIAAWLLS